MWVQNLPQQIWDCMRMLIAGALLLFHGGLLFSPALLVLASDCCSFLVVVVDSWRVAGNCWWCVLSSPPKGLLLLSIPGEQGAHCVLRRAPTVFTAPSFIGHPPTENSAHAVLDTYARPRPRTHTHARPPLCRACQRAMLPLACVCAGLPRRARTVPGGSCHR